MIDNDNPLIFTHIPKTGGMSLFASLTEHYGIKIADMYNMSALDENHAAVAEVLENSDFAVYAGHFPFGLHEWLSRPSYYMAFLRKPLERVISLYHYSIGFRSIMRKTYKITGKTVQDQIKSGEHPDFYTDFLPWINGNQTLSMFLNCKSPELDNGMVRRFSGLGLLPAQCPLEALDLAKQNIEKYYSLVGIQERYAESVDLARAVFKINFKELYVNKGKYTQKNATKLTMSLKLRIRNMNQLDTQLYDWVLERFEKALVAPPQSILVDGKSRSDFDQVKLWHAIGSSPMRKAAMELSPASSGR